MQRSGPISRSHHGYISDPKLRLKLLKKKLRAADQILIQKKQLTRNCEDAPTSASLKLLKEVIGNTEVASKRKRRNKTFESSLLNEFTRQFPRHHVYTDQTEHTDHTIKSQASLQAEANRAFIYGPEGLARNQQDLSKGSSSTHSRKRS